MNEITGRLDQRGSEAYVYVVEFSDGTTKPGFSAQPEKRLARHRDAAACFGITIKNAWVSGPHLEAKSNEKSLIVWCGRKASTVRKAEYFTGLRFQNVRSFAERLPMTRHTDASFEAEGEAVRRKAHSWISFAQGRDGFPVENAGVVRLTGDLLAENVEDVTSLARLADLAIDSARLALSHDSTRRVIFRFLDDLASAYAVKDEPLGPCTISAWDYLTNPSYDGKYFGLIEPLFEAASGMGIGLEEQFHELTGSAA